MINIVICDDSADYSELIQYRIKHCLNDLDVESNITLLNSLQSLKDYLKSNRPDILFLDIVFGEESSVDWSIHNLSDKNLQLVFMTEFPVEAYNISDVSHSYFLVKSRTTDEILKKSLQKALGNFLKKDPGLTVLKSGNLSYTVDYSKMIYIESTNNNIQIHLQDGSQISVYSTLKKYLETLPPNFLRCHKSFVVNMNHIYKAKPHEFLLSNGALVPIPPRKYKYVIEKYNNYLNNF